jgi:hypothetical protein
MSIINFQWMLGQHHCGVHYAPSSLRLRFRLVAGGHQTHRSVAAARHSPSHRLAQTGEGLKEAELLRWFVEEGGQAVAFEPLCELQFDKAAQEISSPYTGGRVGREPEPQPVGAACECVCAERGICWSGRRGVQASALHSVRVPPPQRGHAPGCTGQAMRLRMRLQPGQGV